ncbi:hypothetical protein GGI15_002708 [Coemansia interrupta]|uniref:Smr domain-containing protein n=1 Tax=Coemansia interrupta TaxID=1126814 RepID=A0A9W8HFY5_9FUNG|nr:hypothetical protein GGI15_002708 [Coemansia interrupta]
MITLASLISDYGDYVDRNLITSIWAEQNQDQQKCRNIIHMLSGQPDPKNHIAPTPTASECISAGHSDIFSQGSSPSEHSSQSGHTAVPGMRSHSRTPANGPDAIKSPAALVAFLAACFPECGHDYLETKAKEIFTKPDQGAFQVDPVEAIDIISNALYNDLEAIEMQEYIQTHNLAGLGYDVKDCSGNGLNGRTSTSLSAIEAQYSVGAVQTKPGKGKKGKGKGVQQAGAKNKRASSVSQPDNRTPTNAWSEINSELDAICAMFPMLSVGTVKATFHKCGANVDQTVESLSAQVASKVPDKSRKGAGGGTLDQRRKPDPPPPSPPAAAQTYAALQMMFPDAGPEILEAASQKTADINSAIDLVLRLISEAQSAPKPRTDKMGVRWQRANELSSHRIASSATSGANGHIDQSDNMEVRDVFERIPLADLSGDARIWVSEHNVDPAYCRKRSEEMIAKRNELYAKAAMAYSVRKGQRNHSGTALYYSTEGHKYDARARVWRMRAAQAVVASGRQNDSSVIDLHGLSRMEAVAVALEEVNSWYVRLSEQHNYSVKNPVTPLHIVTGIGNRSANSKAIIHPAIVKALREDGWWFEENLGYVDVLGIKQGGARVRAK